MAGHGKSNRRVKHANGISRHRLRNARGKTAKKTCALCRNVLHGTPHGKKASQVSKLAKSEKRPSGLFGGILCSKCRHRIMEEAIRIHAGNKSAEESGLSERGFVEQALQYLNNQ
jgi:large subunit ribosomal protein L34e